MSLKETIDQAVELLQSIRAESFVLKTEAPASPEATKDAEVKAPAVDPEALKFLQLKIDNLAVENKALREAIKAEIDDAKVDTKRLEDAIADHAEPAPTPVVDVETVSSAAIAEEKVSSPDQAAKPLATF